jgi:hypothetical protein
MQLLRKKLPPNMNSPLWNDFMDCIEEESALIKEKILEKKYLYDIEKMDYDRLLEIAILLGVPFDVSINNTEEFLRDEIRSISFKLKWKATVKYFKSLFKVMKREGNIYIYYYTGDYLIRHTKGLLQNIVGASPLNLYVHESEENFTGFISSQLKLDTGWKLDEVPVRKLDVSSSKRNTKHFALEIYLDKYFYSGGEGYAPESGLFPSTGLAPSLELSPSPGLAPKPKLSYLITPDYFDYLKMNSDFSRKVTDVIHIGCQFNILVDNSRFYDSLGTQFTNPNTLMNSVTTDYMSAITSVDDITHIVLGITPNTNLPSQFVSGTPQPTALMEQIAKIPILTQDKHEIEDWYGVTATYRGKFVTDVLIGTGDGTTSLFTETLDYAPIKKGNLSISFTSNSTVRTVTDNFRGEIDSEYAIGTINNETGELSLQTVFFLKKNEILGIGDGVDLTFDYLIDPSRCPVRSGHVLITYLIGGTTFVATDDGLGVITGTNCTGTINYSGGDISLTFTQAPFGNIDLSYEFEESNIPDNGTPITCSYYYDNDQYFIMEAGVLDASGNLLAYSAFPRISFRDFTNHLSISFLIKKTNF